MINENVSFESRFSFTAVNEDNIQREILNLSSEKPGKFGNILKSSSKICNVVLQNICNSEILGKFIFLIKTGRCNPSIQKKRSYSSWKL